MNVQRLVAEGSVIEMNSLRHITPRVQSRGRSHYLYGKREGGALKLFDQPISETTLSYFARVLDAAGLPKEMSERRKRELHRRERGVFGSTITNLAAADGFSDQVSVSTEPIAFL